MVKVRNHLSTNDGEIAVNWALEGKGIVQARGMGYRPLPAQRPRWYRCCRLPDTPPADIYAMYPQRHAATSARQRIRRLSWQNAFPTAPRALRHLISPQELYTKYCGLDHYDDDPMETSTTSSIVESLTRAIVEHSLLPGTKLAEQKLADHFGVSRTLVRQALFQLSQNRLVPLEPARGAFVATPSVEEARQVFAVRRMLEAEMVRAFLRQSHARANQRASRPMWPPRRRPWSATTWASAPSCWATSTCAWPSSWATTCWPRCWAS